MAHSGTIKFEAAGKKVRTYPALEAGAPVVYAVMFADPKDAIARACRARGCPPFSWVCVSGLSWDEELSPWPSEPVVTKDDHFTGGANEFLRLLTEEILPEAERRLAEAGVLGPVAEAEGEPQRVLCGYSMSGLLAVYAPYVTDAFCAVTSGSGSLWFPGFEEFTASHGFVRRPEAVYLSLGRKESHTRNPALNRTQAITQGLCERYRALGIPCVFELNPGGHHTDPFGRVARGLEWTLGQLAGGDGDTAELRNPQA